MDTALSAYKSPPNGSSNRGDNAKYLLVECRFVIHFVLSSFFYTMAEDFTYTYSVQIN